VNNGDTQTSQGNNLTFVKRIKTIENLRKLYPARHDSGMKVISGQPPDLAELVME